MNHESASHAFELGSESCSNTLGLLELKLVYFHSIKLSLICWKYSVRSIAPYRAIDRTERICLCLFIWCDRSHLMDDRSHHVIFMTVAFNWVRLSAEYIRCPFVHCDRSHMNMRLIASCHAIDRASGFLLSVSFLGKLRSIAPYRAIDRIEQFFYAFVVRSIAPYGRSIA